jgi:uncharacterized protein (DUF1697 family)
MSRYIAFLRAINVGGHTVKMDVLRGLFEDLELRNVETFIASGNVLFDSAARSVPGLEARIETHLERELGYEVATFIRTPAQIAAVGAYVPSAAKRGGPSNSLYVGFLKAAPGPDATAKVLKYQNDIDAFDFHQHEIYWSSAATIGTSKFSGALLERAIKMPATFRNITTVRRLAAEG